MRSLLFAVAALAVTGGPAMAETKPQNGWLTLSAPTTRDHVIFDGAVWRCKSDVCRSPQVKSLPPLRSCKRLARELGSVAAFSYRGVVLSDAQLAECNAPKVARIQGEAKVAAAR